MLRLIATDLDGTLLRSDGTMPEDAFDTIKQLETLGVRFAAASGRQYGNLRRLFSPVAERMAFVCENGAVNVLDETVIGTIEIPRELGLEILDDIEAAGMDVLVSGRHTCYISAGNREYADDIVYRLRNTVTVVDDFRAIPEPYLKISGHTKNLAACAPALTCKWSGRLNAVVAGERWFDFTVGNKGMGLKLLMDRLGVTPSETAAFGDNFNDESMLDAVGYPYVMDKADHRLRKPGVTVCSDVVAVLKEIVKANGRLS